MPIEKVNTTQVQADETNVDWIANGERLNETNINRPARQVAEVLNNAIDEIEIELADINTGSTEGLQEEIDNRIAADRHSSRKY